MQVAIWVGFFVELFGIPVAKHFGEDALVFRFGTVAIDDAVGLGEPGGLSTQFSSGVPTMLLLREGQRAPQTAGESSCR